MVVVACGLSACGGGGSSDTPATTIAPDATVTTLSATTLPATTAVETTTPATTSPTTTRAPDPTRPTAEEALAFFRSTEAQCADFAGRVGNSPIDPSFFSDAHAAGEAPGGGWAIVDGAGNDLVVDLDERVVFSADGRESVLPPAYSFGCPERLYLGSSWD